MPNIQILAEAYAIEPTPENRKHLVLASVPLVRSIIHRLNLPSHPCLSFEDLQGIGLLGLMESIDRYDPERGTTFITFVYGRIHGSMIDYLRLVDVLPRRRRRAVARAQRAFDELCQEQGGAPSEEDVAQALGISPSDYRDLVRDARRRDLRPLDRVPSDGVAPHGDDTGSCPGPHECEDALDAFARIDAEITMQQVRLATRRCLSEREQLILRRYYDEGLTQAEIAAQLGVTEARISQILSAVHKKLRTALDVA